MKKLILFTLTFLLVNNFISQNKSNWNAVKESDIKLNGKRQIIPQKYLCFKLVVDEFKKELFSAPNENSVKINESKCIITLPLPNGKLQQFKVVESPIMEPALAKQFPDMKTFSIRGIDDIYANGKVDWNEFGFHAMIRTVEEGDFFIDPFCVSNTTDYISYYTKDFVKDPSQRLPEEGVIKTTNKSQGNNSPKKKEESELTQTNLLPICNGSELRIFRLAIGCTRGYAIAATGSATPTRSQTLQKIVTSVNRVSGVYETEVGIRFLLIGNDTMVIGTNAGNDPYSLAANTNASLLLSESTTVIPNIIGNANFDIGHTFSSGVGGVANLGVVCFGQKAGGITGGPNPVGDPYDIDYVAHEIGHQFGSDHTFNANTGSCNGNRADPTAVEPGSGVTLMGYAGICGGGNDLAGNSIAYFQAVSFDEVLSYVTSISCQTTTVNGNNVPVVTGSGDYIIPKSTAFVLTGSATDADGDPLTYSWEEVDPGILGNWNSGNKPYFRSYVPVTVPYRSFPSAAVVATGNYTNTKGEYAPPTAQLLKFRLTARDNKAAGGGVCSAVNNVSVDASGPFIINYPSAPAITWYYQGTETILWNVNGTNAVPVSCDTVRILISYNSGSTYSVLTNSTPNDGSETMSVPTVTALINTCRIKIEGKGNIFYDMSDNNFTISNLVQGIHEISKNNPVDLKVWPSPFINEFNISAANLNSSSPVFLKITDVLGKIIFTAKYTGKTELRETINLSAVNAGLYFVSLTNDNLHSVHRIVKD